MAGIGVAFRIPSFDVEGGGIVWNDEAAGIVDIVSNVWIGLLYFAITSRDLSFRAEVVKFRNWCHLWVRILERNTVGSNVICSSNEMYR